MATQWTQNLLNKEQIKKSYKVHLFKGRAQCKDHQTRANQLSTYKTTP